MPTTTQACVSSKNVRALFQERRKTIHNGLCLMNTRQITKQQAAVILAVLNLSPKKRAEELTLADYRMLAQHIALH